VRACEAVLDRCYGKPPQAVEVSGDVSPVVVTRATREDVAHALSDLQALSPALIAEWERRAPMQHGVLPSIDSPASTG
jgi:hypothetical protein